MLYWAVHMGIVHETTTDFHHVRIVDDEDGRRLLLFDASRNAQTVAYPNRVGELVSSYTKYATLALCALPAAPERVLFIGLGGGVMPMFYRRHFPCAQLDIVELDSQLLPLAQQFFGFAMDDNIRVVHHEGRTFIDQCQDRYDIIVLDAFTKFGAPFKLSTFEALQRLSTCLTPYGVMVTNVFGLEANHAFYAQARSIQLAFPHVALFRVPDRSNEIFLGSAGNTLLAVPMRGRAAELTSRLNLEFNLMEMLYTRFELERFGHHLGQTPCLHDGDVEEKKRTPSEA